MKQCHICKLNLSDDNFSWKNKSKNIRQSRCRECNKVYQRKKYAENKEYYLKKIKETKVDLIHRNLLYIKTYLKTHPCVDCGNTDIRVLQFDHIKGDKKGHVVRMARTTYSIDILKQEVSKCEIRCSNCHIIRTWPHRLDDIN